MKFCPWHDFGRDNVLSEILHDFDTGPDAQIPHLQLVEYSGNGAKHLYAVDELGKKRHISHDAVLESYGHAPRPKGPLKLDFVTALAMDTRDLIQGIDRSTLSEENKATLDAAVIKLKTATATPIDEPLPDDTPEKSPSKFGRVAVVGQWLGAQLIAVQTTFARKKAEEAGSPEKHGSRKGLWYAAAAIGGVAIIAFLAKDGIHLPGGGGHGKELADSLNPTQSPTPDTVTIVPGQILEPIKPDSGPLPGGQVSETLRTLTEGQNPWSESIDYAQSLGFKVNMQHTSDVTFIDAVKDTVLRTNHLTEQDALRLHVGTNLKMPSPERMAELYEKYKETK